MRKFFLLLLIILTTSGCGSQDDDKTLTVGMLTQLNSTPEQAAKFSGGEINFYDNFNAMQAALQAKQIDKIQKPIRASRST